jgi:tRNA (mo5U34)-methyltransferase
MTSEELKSQIATVKWHHSIDLGNGIVTPGQDNSRKKLERLRLPESFAGKTVLDIGAWDGFFSFEAERRGAKRVLATDSFVWRGNVDWAGKRGFDLSKRVLGSKVEEKEIDVLDLSPEKVGTFDVVFFLGVLYHMKHPLLALERVASVAKDFLVLETAVDMLRYKRPAMAFYVGDDVGRDVTNWCGPNPAAVVGMLKTVGFKRVEVVAGLRSPVFRFAKGAYYWRKVRHQFWSTVRTDRIVVHAWK